MTRVGRLEVLEVREGLWCRPCGLPSAAQIVVVWGGTVGRFVRCRDCGSDDVEDG